MTVAEFALRVTHAIGIDAATANSATSQEYTLFLGWLNESVVQFLRLTKVFKTITSISLTAAQENISVASTILALEDVVYNPASGQSRSLEQVDSSQIFEMRAGVSPAPTTGPSWYAYEGQQILLYPPAVSASDVLDILAVPRPTAMTATTATPSATANGGVPDEYHPVLESYVKWKAAEHSNDKSSGNGQAFKQEWDAGIVAARSTEMRKGGVLIGSVNLGRRDWRRYASPGVDVG